jgi:hypothetical protein
MDARHQLKTHFGITMNALTMTWGIAGLTALGVITRPFAWPEAIWTVIGAVLLVALGLIDRADAWAGIAKGIGVYLFLIGIMLLSELAGQRPVRLVGVGRNCTRQGLAMSLTHRWLTGAGSRSKKFRRQNKAAACVRTLLRPSTTYDSNTGNSKCSYFSLQSSASSLACAP